MSAAVTAAALPRAGLAQTPPADAPSPATDTPADPAVQHNTAQLVDILNNPQSTQPQRDEAARRLLQRQTDEARQVLRQVLTDVGNRGGQLAVAQALANIPTPLDMFKDPLFALLGPDRQLTEAGALALSNYKGNPEVLTRLASFANDRRNESTRPSAIRALGRLVEKRAAQVLMNLLTNTDENVAIRTVAADALAEMTGIRENARGVADTQSWQQWWTDNQGKSDAEFKEALLYNRASRFDQLNTRYQHLRGEIQKELQTTYQSAPEAQKPEIVLRYLKSAVPEFRAVGARTIRDEAISARPVPAVARQRLREMIGDSSAEVRLEVADAFRVLNDADALDLLLVQLKQEPNSDVRAALAVAIAPIRNARAVPDLLKLLRDSSFRAAAAAANALREMAPVIRQDAAMSQQVSAELVRLIDETAGNTAATDLREACVEALVQLRDPSMLGVYTRLLRANESSRVRQAALTGLGLLGEARAADTIASALDDPDGRVRLRAVEALNSTAGPAHAERLWQRMDPNVEAEKAVREQAWKVLQSLFPSTQKEQLAQWAARFRAQPERRLTVLLALRDQLVRDRDEAALAAVRQNIGETYMELNRPADATQYFKMSLDYYRARNVRDMVTEGLVRQYMDSLLGSKQYVEACAFAAESIASNPSDQPTMGSKIRSEAERLRDAGSFEDALALLDAASQMNPPLDARYLGMLNQIRDEIRQRQSDQGAGGAAAEPNAGAEL